MNSRANQLLTLANGQIDELASLISERGAGALQEPCPGREKLGDGTVAACALHTADNYHRIANFPNSQSDSRHGRITRFLHGQGAGAHDDNYAAENVNLGALLDRLSNARAALGRLADLTDEQLDTVPPASDIKFCDGQRTVEQILTSLLNHQNHQVDALKAAIA